VFLYENEYLGETLSLFKNEKPEIFVDEETRIKAVKPIERMLEISARYGL